MADITMPQLGETVTEGTITRWAKQVGDQVAEDEVLFEVSTDKVDSEVPSPAAGYLSEILVQEGETVDVGVKLAVISAEAPSGNGAAAPAKQEPAPAKQEPAAEQASDAAAQQVEEREAGATETEMQAEPPPETKEAKAEPEPAAKEPQPAAKEPEP